MLSRVHSIAGAKASRDRPVFLVLTKQDALVKCLPGATSLLSLMREASHSYPQCEVVSVSAFDGSGIAMLLHLLSWRLLSDSSPSRQYLLSRPQVGGHRLFHRTAGAMSGNEVLRAVLGR